MTDQERIAELLEKKSFGSLIQKLFDKGILDEDELLALVPVGCSVRVVRDAQVRTIDLNVACNRHLDASGCDSVRLLSLEPGRSVEIRRLKDPVNVRHVRPAADEQRDAWWDNLFQKTS